VSFLYPLFLAAGATLAIPVLIHLFNLRRYKTVLFPHTRFLKNIQLKSQKQSKIRYKWLLALRVLFLTCLILAFAQPFFNTGNKTNTANRLQVIYIDNSGSMTAKQGSRTLLDIAKDAARKQVLQANPGTKYLLLTNDKPVSYKPLPSDKVLTELNAIGTSAKNKTSEQVFAFVQNITSSETYPAADLYYYSDYQLNNFTEIKDKSLLDRIHFYGIPVRGVDVSNVYIDTAFFDVPVLQTGENARLIVRTKAVGKEAEEVPVLQLAINGQMKSAATLGFKDSRERVDTINFQLNDSRWQQISLTLNDALRFDDTFRIAARSTPNLSVLLLNDAAPNAYIQAAFRTNNNFRFRQLPVSQIPQDLGEYNLVILNDVKTLDNAVATALNKVLEHGHSVCIFPGETNNLSAINNGLKQLADIRITHYDSSAQTIASLQQGNSLVKDIFETIPPNVQLPVTNWHYVIEAGLSANQQSVFSFRNGDPFLAQYSPGKGNLYICATTADLQSGNFASSYFFVPFLYQMAMQSHGSDIYSLTAGNGQPAYIPLNNAGERNMIHLYGAGIDAIPPQQPNGSGLNVFPDQSVTQPGFYTLSAGMGDTTMIALNSTRTESQLENRDLETLKTGWTGDNIHWIDIAKSGVAEGAANGNNFPLWKVCVILALLLLAAETLVLSGSFRKQTVATQ
jgi:hypothetical protein